LPDRRVENAQDVKAAKTGQTIRELAAELDALLAAQKAPSSPIGSTP
jgi:hypothetical protein